MGRWVGQPTTVPNRRPSPEVTAAAATPMPSWRRPLAPITPAPLTDRAPGPNARPPRRRSPTSPAHPNRAGWRGRRAGRPATAASSWCGTRRPATATLSSKQMAADNHTTIVGNLVDDPELRFTNTRHRRGPQTARIARYLVPHSAMFARISGRAGTSASPTAGRTTSAVACLSRRTRTGLDLGRPA